MDIAFSHFVDFLIAAGTKRVVTASKQAREARGIPFDLYRPFKDLAIRVAAGGQPDEVFDRMLAAQTDRLARKHYPDLIKGMRAFLRRMQRTGATYTSAPKPVGYLLPPSYTVRVNPELGFTIDGVSTIVKMYCRIEPLDRARIEMSCGVLAASFGSALPSAKFGLLAVREGKLHIASDAIVARAVRATHIDAKTYGDHIDVAGPGSP